MRLRSIAVAGPLAVLACLSGCDAPTTLLVDVSLRAGSPAPASLSVSVFGPRGRIGRAENLAASPLPGRLVVTGLPDEDGVVRVAVVDSAGGSRAGVRAPFRAHAQTHVSLELAADVPDADRDGVPDLIDVCPDDADPEQLDSDGAGAGDACGGASATDLPVGDLPPADASTDLATPDLAMPDLVPPTDLLAPPSVCPGSYLFCEGFDTSAALTRFNVDTHAPLTSVSIDTSRAYRGAASVKFTGDTRTATQPNTYLQGELRKTSPLPRDPVWFRFFVYFPSSYPALETALIKLSQTADPFGLWALAVDGRTLITYTTSSLGLPTQRSTTNLPVDRWACVEVGFDFAPADAGAGTNTARVFLDGTEITALASPPFSPSPAMTLQALGLETNLDPGVAPFSFWVDEYVVDSQRVGCGN
jgi:hypothetical protein